MRKGEGQDGGVSVDMTPTRLGELAPLKGSFHCKLLSFEKTWVLDG